MSWTSKESKMGLYVNSFHLGSFQQRRDRPESELEKFFAIQRSRQMDNRPSTGVVSAEVTRILQIQTFSAPMKRRKVQAQSSSGTLKSNNFHTQTSGGSSLRPGQAKSRAATRRPARRRGLLARTFLPSTLSGDRVRFAYTVAVFGDALQLAVGLFGSSLPNEAAVVPAVLVALLLIPALGFHILLLPTLILELIPSVNTLPAFTACVALVVALRKK
jgi:hypothetical protein